MSLFARRLGPRAALCGMSIAVLLGGCAIHYPYYPAPEIPNDDADLAGRLGWLEGTWFRKDGTRESEQHWSTARGGTLIGMARTVEVTGLAGAGGADGGVRTVEHEFHMIEHTDGGVLYRSWPKGKDPATFRLVAARVKSAVFEDSAHEPATHVTYYLREAPQSGLIELCVRVESSDNGAPRASEACYARAAPVTD